MRHECLKPLSSRCYYLTADSYTPTIIYIGGDDSQFGRHLQHLHSSSSCLKCACAGSEDDAWAVAHTIHHTPLSHLSTAWISWSLRTKVSYLSKKKKKKYLARSVANQHCQGMTGDKIQNVINCSRRKMNAGNYTQRSNLCGGVLRVSRRSEVSQREENEVGETDDVTVETHQIHLPWVKITQGQIGDGGIMNRRVPFAASRQKPPTDRPRSHLYSSGLKIRSNEPSPLLYWSCDFQSVVSEWERIGLLHMNYSAVLNLKGYFTWIDEPPGSGFLCCRSVSLPTFALDCTARWDQTWVNEVSAPESYYKL